MWSWYAITEHHFKQFCLWDIWQTIWYGYIYIDKMISQKKENLFPWNKQPRNNSNEQKIPKFYQALCGIVFDVIKILKLWDFPQMFPNANIPALENGLAYNLCNNCIPYYVFEPISWLGVVAGLIRQNGMAKPTMDSTELTSKRYSQGL